MLDKSSVWVEDEVDWGIGIPPMGGKKPRGFGKGILLVTLVVGFSDGLVSFSMYCIKNVILWWSWWWLGDGLARVLAEEDLFMVVMNKNNMRIGGRERSLVIVA